MDGTFDQVKPLDLLHGVKGCAYSVDLKAATDRWPLLVLFELAQALFDRSTASAVVNSTLGTNVFDVAFTKKRSVVAFVPGQPLGLFASWPLFALSHHLIIWWAAEQVYPGGYFDKYALLGDDVLIVDDRVCQQYRLILERLGVGVSEGKCLTSPSGGCEFAKKMRLRAMTVDASPLSLKKLLDLSSLLGFYNFVITHPKPLRVSTMLRLMGLGFKACSRPFNSTKHGAKARRILAVYTFAKLKPFGLRLVLSSIIGQAVHPEVYGLAVEYMLQYFRPKDPMRSPSELFPYPGMEDFLEYSMYRNWMTQYLAYLKWYAECLVKPDLTLDDFINAPIYVHTSYRPNVDLDHVRFGVMFRMVDKVRKWQMAGPYRKIIGLFTCSIIYLGP
jgi:hypothetical protein